MIDLVCWKLERDQTLPTIHGSVVHHPSILLSTNVVVICGASADKKLIQVKLMEKHLHKGSLEFGEINLQRDHPQNEKMPGDVKQQPSSTWSLQLQHKILEGDWIPPPHSAVIIEELSSCTSKQECSNNIKQSEEGEWILPHIAVVIEELSPCTSKQEGRDSKQCGGFLAIKELVESFKVEEEQHHKEACHKENVQLVDCASEAVLRTAESTNLRSQGDDGVTKSGKTCARDSQSWHQ